MKKLFYSLVLGTIIAVCWMIIIHTLKWVAIKGNEFDLSSGLLLPPGIMAQPSTAFVGSDGLVEVPPPSLHHGQQLPLRPPSSIMLTDGHSSEAPQMSPGKFGHLPGSSSLGLIATVPSSSIQHNLQASQINPKGSQKLAHTEHAQLIATPARNFGQTPNINPAQGAHKLNLLPRGRTRRRRENANPLGDTPADLGSGANPNGLNELVDQPRLDMESDEESEMQPATHFDTTKQPDLMKPTHSLNNVWPSSTNLNSAQLERNNHQLPQSIYRAPFFTSWFVSIWNILFMPVFTLISSCCFRGEDSNTKRLLV